MSRIHEALRKAEQERILSSAGVDEKVPEAGEQTDWNSSASLTKDAQSPAPELPGAMVPADLRFDDMRNRCSRPEWHPDPNVNVFFNPTLSVHGAEQFRTLRSRLYQIRNAQPLRTVLVTSSVPGEGKTFVVTNLAQAIVRQPDRRALVIDADLRCARVHTVLGAPAGPGLSDYLLGVTDEISIIQHGQEGNLYFIPGGNQAANPSELLSNGRLQKLLEYVSPLFDWIIVDSPPCLPVADATILADSCDGVILVARAQTTPSVVAQRACQEMHGKNIVGVVLNAVQDSSYQTYYSQGYGYLDGQESARDSQN